MTEVQGDNAKKKEGIEKSLEDKFFKMLPFSHTNYSAWKVLKVTFRMMHFMQNFHVTS